MGHFHIPIEKPDEIIPRLGKQQLHWKKGRSAFELSTAWINSGDIPASVRATIEKAPEYQGAQLLEGIFERKTSLPGQGYPSQTDLMAILALRDGNAILGVEGKVDEPFGATVETWLSEAKDGNRLQRIGGLCATLGIDVKVAGKLYYQLCHRTCASLYEAKRFGYSRAVMLIHSFAEVPDRPGTPACFEEFRSFAAVMGMPVNEPGAISPSKLCDGVELRLAWVSDHPSP